MSYCSALVILCCFCVCGLYGIQYQPWLGNVFEFEARAGFRRQIGDSIAGHDDHDKHVNVNANTGYASLGLTFDPAWSVELECLVSKTKRHHGFDTASIGCRHLWYNDLIGDFASLTTGIELLYTRPAFLHDISLIRHGRYSAAAHASIGKEFGFTARSYFRTYATALVGAGDKSAAWTRGETHLEWRYHEQHSIDAFFAAEQGLGNKGLRHPRAHDFRGYRHIEYSFLDAGLSYSYTWYPFATFYANVTQRLHAHFCPKNTTSFEVGCLVPFSL